MANKPREFSIFSYLFLQAIAKTSSGSASATQIREYVTNTAAQCGAPISPSVFHVTMKKLLDAAAISASGASRNDKSYHITDSGRDQLAHITEVYRALGAL